MNRLSEKKTSKASNESCLQVVKRALGKAKQVHELGTDEALDGHRQSVMGCVAHFPQQGLLKWTIFGLWVRALVEIIKPSAHGYVVGLATRSVCRRTSSLSSLGRSMRGNSAVCGAWPSRGVVV